MNWKTTLLLLIAVLIVGGYIYYSEQIETIPVDPELQDELILEIQPDTVNYLELSLAEEKVVLEKNENSWEIIEPIQARANAGVIERLLYQLELLERTDTITAEELQQRRLSLADYGLEQARSRIIFGNQTKKQTILLGKDTFLSDGFYLQKLGSSDIIVTTVPLINIVPEELDDLRDRKLFARDSTVVDRLVFQRGDEYLQFIKRSGENWMLQHPLSTRANNQIVSSLLNEIFNMDIQKFIADGKTAIETYDLEEAELRLTVWFKGEDIGHTLMIGQPLTDQPELLYVQEKEIHSIYGLSTNIQTLMNMNFNDFRDRHLLPFDITTIQGIELTREEQKISLELTNETDWVLSEPHEEQADPETMNNLISALESTRIHAFVDDVTNRASMEFSQNDITISLSTEAENEPIKLYIVRVTDNPTNLLVMFSTEKTAYEISTNLLEAISFDPLFYRDRETLSLEPDTIRRLDLETETGRYKISRPDAATPFTAIGKEPLIVDLEAVSDILTELIHLQTTGYVIENSSVLDFYGLKKPYATLTIGLSGTVGISKVIMFGSDTEYGETYAMIRGRDVVFRIKQSVKNTLTKALTIPVAKNLEKTPDGRTSY